MERLGSKKVLGIWFFLGLLCIVGFALRVRSLGELSFWSDDGFTYLAVAGILKKGFPLLPSGFVYGKHIFYSYVAAIPVAFLGMNEFSLRLMGVIAGTCMIPVIYLAGRKFFNPAVGLFSSLIITFSVWEIEFSRQARYYSLFQLLYLLSLYFFYRGFIEDRKRDKLLTVFCFTLAVLTQQLGLTLVFAFLFLLLIKGARKFLSKSVLPYFVVTLIIFGSYFVIENFFFKVGKLSAYEPGVKGIWTNMFQKFSFHFFKEFQWLYPRMYYLVWLGLIFIAVEFVLMLRRHCDPEQSEGEAISKIAEPVLSPELLGAKNLIPRNDVSIASQPMTGGLTGWSFCYCIFILSLLMMGFGHAHFQPRYVFYLHPVFLFLYSYALFKVGFYVYRLTRRLSPAPPPAIGIMAVVLCVVVAAGFTINGSSPLAAYAIAGRNYGDGMNVKFMPSTSRPSHYDHQSVGNFVRSNFLDEDIVIAMHPIFQYIYVGRYDYWLWSTRFWPAFFRKDGELHENYTGARVIKTLGQLKEVLKESANGRVWIIASPSLNDRAHISRDIARFMEARRERVLFRGRDRISRVFLWSAETEGKFVYEGEGALSRIGRNQFDEEASWRYARVGTVSDGAGHVVFGPYQRFAAGKYRALFRIKADERGGKLPVCTIDVAADSGTTIFAEEVLYPGDFNTGGSYQNFELRFSIPEQKELEFRVYSHGNHDISVDYVKVAAKLRKLSLLRSK